jgi:hypothetical protein
MKTIKYIIFLSLIVISVTSCVENEPTFENFPGTDVAFSYKVDGDYKLDYLVGSTIQFTNESAKSGAIAWDFGDGTTSTEPNPTHKYAVAGIYDITLTIEGIGKSVEKLFVSDILSTITTTVQGDVCEVNTTPVSFDVFTPNPENLTLEYTWVLPEGTVNETGDPVSTIEAQNPGNLKFKSVGSQNVVLRTRLGGRQLQDVTVNVQVGYNQKVKTIYYAVKGGNIMALKLIPNLSPELKNKPFNMGVKSGQHPMNMLFTDSCLYILDAGKQFTYINDQDRCLGDGAISVMRYDGSSVSVMLSNKGYAFYDPYYGYTDGQDIYFADRNTGIRRVNKDLRNLAFDSGDSRFNYFVQNDRLMYYNSAYTYGAMNACYTKTSDGTWYWAKTFAGSEGIYRFKESDISPTPIAMGEKDKPYPVLCPNVFIKSFVIDEARGMVYYAIHDQGFYKATLTDFTTPGFIKSSHLGTLVQVLDSDDEGSASEYVDICQMVLDPEDGSVYFGFRADEGSAIKSGLKRYDPTTNKVTSVIEGVGVYGVAINHTKAKLF